MVLNDFGKLIVLLVVALGGIALCIISLLQGNGVDAVGASIVTGVLGYVTGNGVLAAKGSAPSPVYAPNDDKIVERHVREADNVAAVEASE